MRVRVSSIYLEVLYSPTTFLIPLSRFLRLGQPSLTQLVVCQSVRGQAYMTSALHWEGVPKSRRKGQNLLVSGLTRWMGGKKIRKFCRCEMSHVQAPLAAESPLRMQLWTAEKLREERESESLWYSTEGRGRESKKVQEMTWKTFAAFSIHRTYKMEGGGGGFMKRMSRRYRLFAASNERLWYLDVQYIAEEVFLRLANR